METNNETFLKWVKAVIEEQLAKRDPLLEAPKNKQRAIILENKIKKLLGSS